MSGRDCFQGLLFQIRGRRHGGRELSKVHAHGGEETVGPAVVLLRQRRGGHVDAVRRADGRRMASVRDLYILYSSIVVLIRVIRCGGDLATDTPRRSCTSLCVAAISDN